MPTVNDNRFSYSDKGETTVKRYKRICALLLAFLLTAGTAAGCAEKEQDTVKEKEKITIWYYWSQSYVKKELANLVNGFNRTQDEIEVTTQYVPDEDFKKKLALSMADGNMPELALVDSSDFHYFHAMEPFVDLTDEIKDLEEYLPEVKEACSVEGRMMGLPYGMNCAVLYYNKNIMEVHGAKVPQTWQELYDTAVKLSDHGHYGFGLPAVESEESVYSFLPLLWSMGGEVDSLDSAGSRQAFHLLRQMTESGAMSRQTISLTDGDLLRQFVEGNIAMMITSSSMIASIRDLNPFLKYGVTVLPAADDSTRTTVLGGEIFGVTKGAHQDAAVKFLQYVSDKERMSSYMDRSAYMAPRRDVLEDQYVEDPLNRSMIEIAKSARTREFSVEWPYISRVLTDAMGETVIGEKTEDEILREAAERMAEIRRGDL